MENNRAKTREYAKPRRARAAPASMPADNRPMFRIEPSKGGVSLELREFWEDRELLYFFIWHASNTLQANSIGGGAGGRPRAGSAGASGRATA